MTTGTANDLTGHGHNGTVIGNAQVVPIQGGDVIHANCGPLRLDGISLTSDLLPLINLSGPTGFLYRVDVSPNLSDWLPWVTLSNSSGTIQIIDPGAPYYPQRFYRAVRQ